MSRTSGPADWAEASRENMAGEIEARASVRRNCERVDMGKPPEKAFCFP